jgi:hypothetical protein
MSFAITDLYLQEMNIRQILYSETIEEEFGRYVYSTGVHVSSHVIIILQQSLEKHEAYRKKQFNCLILSKQMLSELVCAMTSSFLNVSNKINCILSNYHTYRLD